MRPSSLYPLATLVALSLTFFCAVAPAAVSFGCRLEPNVAEPYSERIGLGSIHATSKRKTFEATLDQGDNIEAFLEDVTAARPNGYKIIWSQTGAITDHQASDTLLIDDVEVI